jgi:hypothetical protein
MFYPYYPQLESLLIKKNKNENILGKVLHIYLITKQFELTAISQNLEVSI